MTQAFSIPRSIIYGENALEHLSTLSGKKAALVTGGSSMKRFGFLDKAVSELNKAGMECIIIDNVEPNPSIKTVWRGAKEMQAFEPDWIVAIGGGSALDAAKVMWCFYEHPQLKSIGRLSVVPSLFNINEPVIFGTPIVMNPVFFIPFLLAPMVNAVLAWAAMKMDLIGRVISVVPWTAPAPIGGAWALGWDFRAAILVVVLACVSAIIYFPFFKVYEKQLLAQEAEEAQRIAEESQQTA